MQTAIQEAIVESIRSRQHACTLSKESDTYKQSRQGLVKQDLVISASSQMGVSSSSSASMRAQQKVRGISFVSISNAFPAFVEAGGKAESIAERQPFLLFDRMIAFHIQRGATVPMGAAEFYRGLTQRFPERTEVYFLPEQVAESDRLRLQVKEIEQFRPLR